MNLYLLDTDAFSLYLSGHPAVIRNILGHHSDRLAICVTTVEEQLGGWQGALRRAKDDPRRADIYRRMARTVESMSGWDILTFSIAAMAGHAHLLRQRLNVGSNDLKIAAIALESGATVVTRNSRDFGRVPYLRSEDWST